MATTIGASDIKLGGDNTGFIRSLAQARAEVKLFTREVNSNVSQAYKVANASQREFRGGLVQLGNDIQSVGKKAMLMGSLPGLFAAGTFFKDYADLQKLEVGLTRFGSNLEEVRELAKLPNIGIFDGAQSIVQLRAAGASADLATRSIKAFANAITEAGGSANDLNPALVNLQQFLSTGHINQVDLRQLSARIPQMNDALRNAFGTTDVKKLNELPIQEFINGLVTELEKIPPVAGGAGMAMEQLGDSAKFFSAAMGAEIDKAFDVTGKLQGLGNMIDGLARNFTELDPEMKKTILTLGGLAVAVPVLTTGIGALVKYLPVLATGFGLVSWPVAAIAAVTAGVVGLTAVMPLLNNKTAELKAQISDVGASQEKLTPLIKRYDELRAKTELSKDEKQELKKILNDIGGIMPKVAFEFDKYGNVLQIDIDKTKELAQEQKYLLEQLKKTQFESNLNDLTRLKSRRNEVQQMVNTGQVREWVGDASGGMYRTRDLRVDELVDYQNELKSLQKQWEEFRTARREGRNGKQEQQDIVTTEETKATNDLTASYSNLNKELKDLDWVQKELNKIDEAGRYERIIKSIKSATEEYKKLVGVTAGLSVTPKSSFADKESGVSGIINSSERGQSNKDSLKKSSLEGMKEIVAQSKKTSTEYGTSVKSIVEATERLNTEVTSHLREAATGLGAAFGEMLGNMATGVDGLKTFGERVGAVLANISTQMGKSMIAWGTARLAATLMFNNPYTAIAAGVALTALGTAMKNTMSNQMNASFKTARLAKGGSVSREMQVIVGDNPNAHFDPEIISPISKVDGMISKSVQDSLRNRGAMGGLEFGEVRISGEDLFLTYRRVAKRKGAIG